MSHEQSVDEPPDNAREKLDDDLKTGKISEKTYAKKLLARTPESLRARIKKTRQSNAFLWNALLDPQIRAEYKRLEKEKPGSGTEYLHKVSAEKEAHPDYQPDNAAAPKQTFSFAATVKRATRPESDHKSRSWKMVMLLKDPWIRDHYKQRERETKGSGKAFLDHIGKPGMLAKEKDKEKRQAEAESAGSAGGGNGNDSVVANLTDGVKRLVSAANKKREDGDASDSVSDTEKRVNTSMERITSPPPKGKGGRGCCGGKDDGGGCAMM
jgi:hypothetical protein